MKKVLLYLLLLVPLLTVAQTRITTQGGVNTGVRNLGLFLVDKQLNIPVSNGTEATLFPDINKKGAIRVNSTTNVLEYHNGTTWVASGGGGSINQDNIDIIKYVAFTPTSSSQRFQASTFVNNLPQFTLTETQSLWFKIIPDLSVSVDNFPLVMKYKILNKGKGTYGLGGNIQVTEEDCELLYHENITITDIAYLESTDIINITSLGSNTISEYVNSHTPAYNIQLQSEGYTIFQVGTSPDNYISYLYLGDGGIYGQGQGQTNDADFQLLNSAPSPTDLQQTVDAGSTYNKDSEVNRIEVDFNRPLAIFPTAKEFAVKNLFQSYVNELVVNPVESTLSSKTVVDGEDVTNYKVSADNAGASLSNNSVSENRIAEARIAGDVIQLSTGTLNDSSIFTQYRQASESIIINNQNSTNATSARIDINPTSIFLQSNDNGITTTVEVQDSIFRMISPRIKLETAGPATLREKNIVTSVNGVEADINGNVVSGGGGGSGDLQSVLIAGSSANGVGFSIQSANDDTAKGAIALNSDGLLLQGQSGKVTIRGQAGGVLFEQGEVTANSAFTFNNPTFFNQTAFVQSGTFLDFGGNIGNNLGYSDGELILKGGNNEFTKGSIKLKSDGITIAGEAGGVTINGDTGGTSINGPLLTVGSPSEFNHPANFNQNLRVLNSSGIEFEEAFIQDALSGTEANNGLIVNTNNNLRLQAQGNIDLITDGTTKSRGKNLITSINGIEATDSGAVTISTSGAVTSVAGKTGAVSLVIGDIASLQTSLDAKMTNPMTAMGDMIYGNTGGAPTRLPMGANNNVLLSSVLFPSWGKVGLTTHVSGVLPITNGGNGTTTGISAAQNTINTGKANINGNNTTGGTWNIDVVQSPAFTTSNKQMMSASGSEVYWGNPTISMNTFEMATISSLRTYVPSFGFAQIWHGHNFNPDAKLNKNGSSSVQFNRVGTGDLNLFLGTAEDGLGTPNHDSAIYNYLGKLKFFATSQEKMILDPAGLEVKGMVFSTNAATDRGISMMSRSDGVNNIQAVIVSSDNPDNLYLNGFGGNVKVGTSSVAPTAKLDVAGDIKADNIILVAPDGGKWRVTVSNTGTLSTTLVP